MNTRPTQPAPNDDELLARVFEVADRRPPPPEADVREVRAALTATWRDVVRERRSRRRRVLALAASAVLATVVAATWLVPGTNVLPAISVATVEFARGDARGLRVGEAVTAGRRLETGANEAMALRWRSGASLRLRERTLLDIDRDGALTLIAGGVYVDTRAPANATFSGPSFELRTRFGRVAHVGTQYMTEVDDDRLQVRVREGLVEVVDAQTQLSVEAGERLERDASGQTAHHAQTPYGEAWKWAEDAAPRQDFHDRPIAEFLDWLARETGRTVTYASAEAQAIAIDDRMIGVSDPAPEAALGILHGTTDLRARLIGGEIVIDVADSAAQP